MTLNVVSFLSAEIVLLVAALAIYLGGAFSTSQKVWAPIALGAIVLAAASLWWCGGNERYMQRTVSAIMIPHNGSTPAAMEVAHKISAFFDNTPVIADSLSAYGRWFALAIGAVMMLMAWRPLATGGTPEYLGSVLLMIAGLMLVASAANLVLLFVGLELISIPTYILLSLGRRDPAGQEAAAKYFYLSVLASAILLYGLSFLYGTAGSMQLRSSPFQPAAPAGFEILSKLAMVLVVAGLCFRITAAPFHFYAPDVYQGTIQANAALLSVLPKAAGLLALVRLVVLGMPKMGPFGWEVFLALSVLTMTLGNVLALWQENVRRLFAYSSIANAGYMLIGVPGPPAAAGRDRRGAGRFGPHPPLAGCRDGRLHVQPCRPAACRGFVGQADALRQRPERPGGKPAAVVHRPGHRRRIECGGGGLLLSPHRQPDVLSRTVGHAPGGRRTRSLRRGVAVQPGRAGIGFLSRPAHERLRRGGEKRGAGSGERGAGFRVRRSGFRVRGSGDGGDAAAGSGGPALSFVA